MRFIMPIAAGMARGKRQGTVVPVLHEPNRLNGAPRVRGRFRESPTLPAGRRVRRRTAIVDSPSGGPSCESAPPAPRRKGRAAGNRASTRLTFAQSIAWPSPTGLDQGHPCRSHPSHIFPGARSAFARGRWRALPCQTRTLPVRELARAQFRHERGHRPALEIEHRIADARGLRLADRQAGRSHELVRHRVRRHRPFARTAVDTDMA